ncbi:acyl-CoA synthetase, AMP-forming [Citrifermentans bemidjiense Bem]|uniref:Acyl-CoA synthetase, AMP-forming n=1 Tax=Citrifermentans bemidjiense (strain ATCC BAA-1014 / DSM 16622 / JCM 12645 / Bem) TaxID=404380 RepID=B5EH00_CITBB|nr:class I adenylate-forming enzyme family protein [Citrifermentans bemidjiense]ACH38102.1 acyl-CoA synthetase, AMP-forming [Citrifermentans bemidjiense Bem]
MEPAVHNLLENSARIRPDKVALVQGDLRITYRQANTRANRVAGWLIDEGVLPGERVVLLLKNGIEYLAGYYGILKAGAVAVPLNCDLRVDALRELLADLHAVAVICGSEGEQLLNGIDSDLFGIRLLLIKDASGSRTPRGARVFAWDEVVTDADLPDHGLATNASALAGIIYTSGSTGAPKGVMLSHRNIVSNTCSIIQYLGLNENDVQMVVLPFFYVMGKSLLNTHVAVGGTVVVNNAFAYSAPVIRQMAQEGVTGFSGVPSTYAYLLHRSPLAAFRDKLPALRYCTQAGGHMAREIKQRLMEVLPPHTRLYIMYGATEAAARLTYVEPEMLVEKIDSIGRAIPGVTVRVLDEKGEEVAEGEIGELVASGANIMLGYWRDEIATGRVLDANGYHTGDMGYRDGDGYLYVTGRKDHLLKVGGHRLDPQEIEDALMATGELLEVAVLGVDDHLLGKKLVAIAVSLQENPSDKVLLSRCLSRLPRHKIPSEIRFVAALPKYASGKIDRAACLEAPPLAGPCCSGRQGD